MKKVIITSGGTREYVDDVRVLTNISTGKLGAIIAEHFFDKWENGIEIVYIYTKGSAVPINIPTVYSNENNKIHKIEVSDAKELKNKIKEHISGADVIIHAAAVSDFTFGNPEGVKLKSDDPKAFIKHLKKNIKKNPKIISKIKQWNPEVILVGFKFEVGLSFKKLQKVALKSLKTNSADYVVANDKKEMQENNSHIAYIMNNKNGYIKCENKNQIAEELRKLLNI